jgi:branched-chain amino acid transport system substrate-binding protein
MIQASLDSGAFDTFVLADGMFGDALTDAFGNDLNGTIATVPGAESKGAKTFSEMAEKAGITVGGPFTGESYDAAALIALAMQAAGSSDRAAIQSKMMAVANAPGEKINPGELAKGLKILANGGEIDYVGATNVEFNSIGEVFGSYKEMEIKGGKYELVTVH